MPRWRPRRRRQRWWYVGFATQLGTAGLRGWCCPGRRGVWPNVWLLLRFRILREMVCPSRRRRLLRLLASKGRVCLSRRWLVLRLLTSKGRMCLSSRASRSGVFDGEARGLRRRWWRLGIERPPG